MPKPEPFELTDADKYSHVESASDQRTVNNSSNVMRHQYRVLTADEKAKMVHLKDMGVAFLNAIRDCVPEGREASIAKTKIEEAVMWAVKGLTG
jgi:hypothetical protein